jgi:hypothetical protein
VSTLNLRRQLLPRLQSALQEARYERGALFEIGRSYSGCPRTARSRCCSEQAPGGHAALK